jgi:acyl-coenzyme A synthetase/AMP-(fatty) acid ligase
MTTRAVIERPADDVFATISPGRDSDSRQISVAQFCADVAMASRALPPSRHVVNLCQSRYGFMVVFFAVATSGRINLLPGKRDAESARHLAVRYEGCVSVSDDPAALADIVVDIQPGKNGEAAIPFIDESVVVAIPFTSGSTGEPQPHRKTWAMFGQWRHVHWEHVPQELRRPGRIVATVPPWHMYGLEWSMLLPTVAPLTIHCGPDFYPRDVVATIESWPGETLLVSTPLHLRALVRGPVPRGRTTMVVSATAPLEPALTHEVETRLHTRLYEIYGCSEIGSLAWRCPMLDQDWRFFGCFEPFINDGVVTIRHPELPAEVHLPDLFSAGERGGLHLLGRATDVVKVGGKRESLAHLNAVLVSIPDVLDGVFYLPEDLGLPATGRLGALAVAPGIDVRELRSRLAAELDPVFLPRPLHLVPELPRDVSSKLKRESLRRLVERLNA